MLDSFRASRRIGSGLILVAVAAAAAACGGPAASSQPASSVPTDSLAAPSLAADKPLVDILPAKLGGEATRKLALVGSDLSALGPSAVPIFTSLLRVLGSDGADMTVGTASNAKGSLIAIRVTSKTAEEIGAAMIAGRALDSTTTNEEVDLGGKHVIKVTTTKAPVPFYVYATGNVSISIAGADESIIIEALSKLP